jgi:hypothetical protein
VYLIQGDKLGLVTENDHNVKSVSKLQNTQIYLFVIFLNITLSSHGVRISNTSA